MKLSRIISAAAALCLGATICGCSSAPASVFEDDFNGTELDLSKWEKCPESERQGGSYWRDSNSYLDGEGHLVLEITDSGESGFVNCGAIRSKGKFERAFGYYEASICFPTLQGTWGAFWLMGDTVGNVDGSGRDGTEVDIIETIHNESKTCNSALHWDGYDDAHQSTSESYENASIYDGKFHKFALEWTADEYVFYIDDVEMWRTTDGGVCQNPLYLKLSTESAPWAGLVMKKNLPVKMLVDYVKVTEKK